MVYLQFDTEAAAEISILNIQGKPLFGRQRKINKGYTVVPVDLSLLHTGIYVFRIKADGKLLTTKFVVVK